MGCIRKFTFFLLCIAILGTAVPVMAEEAVTASIPVSCKAEGSSETFEYILTPENSEEGQTVLTGSQSLKNGEDGAFVLEFNLPGTYSYKAEQTTGSRTDTSYSKQVYTVKAFVTENEDRILNCEIVAYMDGSAEKADRLLFTNKVTAPTATPSSPKPTDSVKKNQNTNNASAESRTAERVKTGDASKPALFAGLALTAFFTIITFTKKSRRQEEDNA